MDFNFDFFFFSKDSTGPVGVGMRRSGDGGTTINERDLFDRNRRKSSQRLIQIQNAKQTAASEKVSHQERSCVP